MNNPNHEQTPSVSGTLDSAMGMGEIRPHHPPPGSTPAKETYFERYARTTANQAHAPTQGYPTGVDQRARGISTAQVPGLSLTSPFGQTPPQTTSNAMEIDDLDTLKKQAKMKAKRTAKKEKKRTKRVLRVEKRKRDLGISVAQANAYQPSAMSGAVAVQPGQKGTKAQRPNPTRTEPKMTRKARKKLEKKARKDLAQIVPPKEMLDDKEPASPRLSNKNVPKTLMSSFGNFSL